MNATVTLPNAQCFFLCIFTQFLQSMKCISRSAAAILTWRLTSVGYIVIVISFQTVLP